MKNSYLFFTSWILMSTIPFAVRCQDDAYDEIQTLAQEKILQLTYNCQFEEALDISREFLTKDPSSMKWKFNYAFTIWRKYLYLGGLGIRDTSLENEFTINFNFIITTGENILSNNPRDTIALLYAGASLGYLAQFEASNGDYFKAASDGRRGLSYHERLLTIAPRSYDVFLSKGLFNLYTSSVPWFLKPILFILGKSGSTENAYKYLDSAVIKGKNTKYEAEESLAILYAKEGLSDSLQSVYVRLMETFPQASFYYQNKILSYLLEAKKYNDVINESAKAIQRLSSFPMTRVDSMYFGLFYLSLSNGYQGLSDYQRSIKAIKTMLERNIATPLFSWAHLSLGVLYEKSNDSSDAIREYQWVVQNSHVPQHIEQSRKHIKSLVE